MKTADIQELSNFLLDYAVMLMRSGANTERTVRNVTRICKSFGYETAIASATSLRELIENPEAKTSDVILNCELNVKESA